MLLKYYKNYKKKCLEDSKPLSFPGFKAFVLLQYPKAYEQLIKEHMFKDSELPKVKVLLEADMITCDLEGTVNTKAAERVLKKYHDYGDAKETIQESGSFTINIVKDSID